MQTLAYAPIKICFSWDIAGILAVIVALIVSRIMPAIVEEPCMGMVSLYVRLPLEAELAIWLILLQASIGVGQ